MQPPGTQRVPLDASRLNPGQRAPAANGSAAQKLAKAFHKARALALRMAAELVG